VYGRLEKWRGLQIICKHKEIIIPLKKNTWYSIIYNINTRFALYIFRIF
jgi:hypothetical protein